MSKDKQIIAKQKELIQIYDTLIRNLKDTIDLLNKGIHYNSSSFDDIANNIIRVTPRFKELESELSALEQEEEKPITVDQKELKDFILAESKKGNIVYASFEGLYSVPIDDIIKQPVEGLLYDLNRDVATVLTFIEDPKWINDFAVASVITALHKLAFKNQ